MDVTGGVAAILVAAVLVTWLTVLLSRANHDAPLPMFWGRPPNVPRRTKLLQILAAAAGSYGVILLGHEIGSWAILTILVAVAGAVVVQVRHNRALHRRREDAPRADDEAASRRPQDADSSRRSRPSKESDDNR